MNDGGSERDLESLAPAQKIGGAKEIAMAAGVMLLVNNITGPGVPQLPNLFVEAGWLTPVLFEAWGVGQDTRRIRK